MSRSWVSDRSFLVVAAFSRHVRALDWARPQLEDRFGRVSLVSDDFPFHHTTYYEAAMGAALMKRFWVFDAVFSPDTLSEVKHFTISLERRLAESGEFPEERPLNLDPGYLQLGKFLLATTKDQAHRIYLRDGIYAEVTLRYSRSGFEPWPWTYADYQEPAVRAFLTKARSLLAETIQAERKALSEESPQISDRE